MQKYIKLSENLPINIIYNVKGVTECINNNENPVKRGIIKNKKYGKAALRNGCRRLLKEEKIW